MNAIAARLALAASAIACLVAAALGGLARLGVPLEVPMAAANHGAIMTGGFLGTVVSLERAIALGRPYGFGAPLCAALGALLLVAGVREAGLVVESAAPLFLLAVGIDLARRQLQAHIVLLAVASIAWAVGNFANLAGAAPDVPAAWWFAFLVLTIAAERLEMTRLMKRPAIALPLFLAAVALVLLGAAISFARTDAGGIVFGAGLAALAAWLAAFDLARRTVHTEGFARYAAVALLAGYAWLAIGGISWALMSAFDPAWRDAALHALGLGFVFSMILAHAPVVFPVIAKRRMRFSAFFYVPLALLHASLILRLAAPRVSLTIREWGGLANAAAILAFAGTLAWALSRSTATGTRPTTTSEQPRRQRE